LVLCISIKTINPYHQNSKGRNSRVTSGVDSKESK
jgi:hypothetical protein